jgi:hypothetical protein
MNRSLLSAAALTVALFSATASAQTIGCEVGVANGGLIPASGTGGGGTYPTVLPTSISTFPLNVAAIPPGATCVTAVKFTGLAHTWTDDVQIVLQDPTGAMTNLMVRPAGSGDFLAANSYTIVEANATCVAWPTSGNIASGSYPQNFGDAGQVWPNGSIGIFNNDLSTIPAQTGVWNLVCFDWVSADAGSVTSWDLCFGTATPPQPPCSVPVLTSPANGANVFGAYVPLAWNAVGGATSYDVDVDGVVTNVAASPFQYFSAAGMHTWSVRAVNAAGATAYATARTFNDQGLAAPALSAPANGANVFGSLGPINLTWTAVNQASSYDVDVDGVVTNVAGTSYPFVSTPGLHTWTVRALWNANTVTGPYATARNFTDLGAPPSPCTGGTDLNTVFVSNNGGSAGGIVYFDINVLNPAGITLSQLDTNTSLALGNAFGMDVYMKAGTSVGFESNAAAWTLVASGGGISAGQDQHSLVEFTDVNVAPGVSGVALVIIGASHRYTNGTGANQFFSNADLSITLGKANNVPWAASPFSPRVWNGTIRYNCGGAPPVSYCTAGTSSSGCAALITADNQPSVSQANPCNLTVSSVEGQKSGLIFYGLTQAAIPWSTGSTSFLCVKSPTQRTATQSSNGTAGLCDGSLVLDVNNYLTTHPGSLGQPFSAGNKIYAQAWYRDPPAPKTTNLSDGIELTFQP